MRQVMLIDWTDLLHHAQELGFNWNYAHEILRAFQRDNGVLDIYCDEIDEIIPMNEMYIEGFEERNKKDGDLNQMGRDIVYDFMEANDLKEMTVCCN